MNSLGFVVVFTIVCAVVVDCVPQSRNEDIEAKLEGLKKECAEQLKMPIPTVDTFKEPNMDSAITEDIMCFEKCLFEKTGLLSADGTFNPGAITAFNMGQNDKTVQYTKAIEKCKLVNEGKNSCSAVHLVHQCVTKEIMDG